MQKNEVISTLIMESFTEPEKPKNLEVKRENGLFYVEFDSTFQYTNRRNRNNRTYGSRLQQDVHAPHIKELISKNSWCGEAGHPLSNEMSRIMTIDPTMISHHIPFITNTGDRIHGRVNTLDNGAHGTAMTKAILQGLEPAFSLRALTKLTKHPDGSSVAEGKTHVICYDWVILPSHKEAYRDESSAVKKIYLGATADNCVQESVLLPVTESMITDYIAAESTNVNLISNIYEVAKESMTLSADLRNVIIREGDRTFHVKVEDTIQHEIMNFMSRM